MNNDSPLYAYLKLRAQRATDHARNGKCLARWQNAACLWDKAMPHSGESDFVKKLHEETFMGWFDFWRRRQGRSVLKRAVSSNATGNKS